MVTETVELKPKNLHCNERKSGMTWVQCVTQYIENTTALLQRKCSEDELLDMQEELAIAYGSGISYLYGTRKYRDEALGKAYQEFPKGKVLSEEQIARARAKASSEVRLHALIKDLLEAIKFRKQVNTQKIEDRKMER